MSVSASLDMPGSWDNLPDTSEAPTLPAHPLDSQDSHTYLKNKVLSRRHEYLQDKRIKIKVGTWNVAAPIQGTHKDLAEWIADTKVDTVSKDGRSATEGAGEVDIYAIGLQEVVDVNQTQTFLKYLDPKVALEWRSYAQAALPSGYECIACPQLIGILLLVYVSPKLLPFVSSVSSSTVGTGLMGYVGNKGGVGVRLVIDDTLRLVFVDCHLAAFTNAVDRRNWDAAEIHRRMNFDAVDKEVIGLDEHDEENINSAPQQEGLDKADVLLWCGDLNYRLDLASEDIRGLLAPYMPKELPPTHDDISSTPNSPVQGSFKESRQRWLPPPPNEMHPDATPTLAGTVDSLLRHDQLFKQRKEGKSFVGFKEQPIRFLPTYKYDVGTDGTWDSSEKLRAPSWCDRILSRVRATKETQADQDAEPDLGRLRSQSVSTLGKSEVLFETDEEDPEEEDLVVSRAETPVPRHTKSEPAKVAPEIILDDPTSTLKSYSGEAVLHQLSYTSYQSVSSSDHKPVVAVYTIKFPAVVPELRAKVHAEVAREVDKMENERRPVVTVIIDSSDDDPSEEEDIVAFGDVRFGQKKRRMVTVANTGTSVAKMGFVGRPGLIGNEDLVAKDWISIDYSEGCKKNGNQVELMPGESCQIFVSMCVDKVENVRALNERKEVLDDVLVLRVEEGRDVFIPISGRWMQSGFGRSVKDLIQVPEGVGGVRGWKEKGDVDGEVLYSAPRELYKTTEFLLKRIEGTVNEESDEEKLKGERWFDHPGWPFAKDTWGLAEDDRRRKLRVGIWEALDTDVELSDEAALYIAFDPEEEKDASKEEVLEVVTEVFLQWLDNLKEGIIPENLWDEVNRAGGDRKLCEHVLDILPQKTSSVHANVFIYLSGFTAEVIDILSRKRPEGEAENVKEVVMGKVVDAVARVVIRRPAAAAAGKAVAASDERRRSFMKRFVEM